MRRGGGCGLKSCRCKGSETCTIRVHENCSRQRRSTATETRRQRLLRPARAARQRQPRSRALLRARDQPADRAADAPVSATAIGTGDAARVSALPLSSRRRHRPSDAPQVGLGTESEPGLLCCCATFGSPGLRVRSNLLNPYLPLVPLLPLSQPAVQAPIDNPDANPASETTQADEGTPASDSGAG